MLLLDRDCYWLFSIAVLGSEAVISSSSNDLKTKITLEMDF